MYEAAKCIQKAYRSYKGRQKLEEQNKEKAAAIVIQNYYRRYKQYAYYRRMTNAAMIIQQRYRSYCVNKCNKKAAKQEETDAAKKILLTTEPRRSLNDNDTPTSVCGLQITQTNRDSRYNLVSINGGGKSKLEVTASGVYGATTSKEMSPSGPLK